MLYFMAKNVGVKVRYAGKKLALLRRRSCGKKEGNVERHLRKNMTTVKGSTGKAERTTETE
jgi:hypothetical protein